MGDGTLLRLLQRRKMRLAPVDQNESLAYLGLSSLFAAEYTRFSNVISKRSWRTKREDIHFGIGGDHVCDDSARAEHAELRAEPAAGRRQLRPATDRLPTTGGEPVRAAARVCAAAELPLHQAPLPQARVQLVGAAARTT
jgi:hypothetical protein